MGFGAFDLCGTERACCADRGRCGIRFLRLGDWKRTFFFGIAVGSFGRDSADAPMQKCSLRFGDGAGVLTDGRRIDLRIFSGGVDMAPVGSWGEYCSVSQCYTERILGSWL